MDKRCKLSLQGNVNYYSSSDFCIIVGISQSRSLGELSGAPAVASQEGAASFSQYFETPEKDFYDEWVSWALGRGVDCLIILMLLNAYVPSR